MGPCWTFSDRLTAGQAAPDWADVTRVVFQPLTESGAPGIVAIDNINAAPVPEPSALALTGLGLVSTLLIYRRRRFGSARS